MYTKGPENLNLGMEILEIKCSLCGKLDIMYFLGRNGEKFCMDHRPEAIITYEKANK